MKRSLQMILGLLLALAAFGGAILANVLTRPPEYAVAVVVTEVAPFTPLTADQVQIDVQTISEAVAAKYILADEWDAMLNAGDIIAVESLHPGQPLLREALATGDNAGKVKRLSVALTDPELVIINVPVEQGKIPAVYPGDAIALFYSAGQLQAQKIATDVVTAANLEPTPAPALLPGETASHTLELQLPLSKWIANGLVYRLNREVKDNPNYGAPGSENEPATIEGAVNGLDVVVSRETAEWMAFALAHGKVQVGVLPAVAVPEIKAGTLPPSRGVTWSDLEDRFFEDRPETKSTPVAAPAQPAAAPTETPVP